MSKRLGFVTVTALAACVVLALSEIPAAAAPLWTIRTDGSGNALNLGTNQGWQGMQISGMATTSEGYIAVDDSAATGSEMHVLDPAKTTVNGQALVNAAIGYVCDYGPDNVYKGSVAGGVSVNRWIRGYLAGWPSTNMIFPYASGPNGPGNCQLRDSNDNYSATAGKMAALTDLQGIFANWAAGIAVVASGSDGNDTYRLTCGLGSGGGSMDVGVRKTSASALTPGTNNYGTRTYTGGGDLTGGSGGTAASFVADLVPSISDNVVEMAWNDPEGRLYFVSNWTDGQSVKHVYLSAATFAWGVFGNNSPATYVDLDPDTANNYLEITYVPGGGKPALTTGNDITFSPDGRVLYVGGTDGTTNRVWIFDGPAPPEAAVPEPAGLALLLGLPLVLRRRPDHDARHECRGRH